MKKKKPKLKKTPQYKQGEKDCQTMLDTVSYFLVGQMTIALGIQRKHAANSHVNLYRYCEGWNDCLDRAGKEKGVVSTQEVIGR